jgi:hypothetical protein
MNEPLSFVKECLGKKHYHQIELAEKVAKRVARERGVVLRVYYCKYCLCFHLTRSS